MAGDAIEREKTDTQRNKTRELRTGNLLIIFISLPILRFSFRKREPEALPTHLQVDRIAVELFCSLCQLVGNKEQKLWLRG